MNEKSILSLLIGPGIFSKKELKEVASKTLNPKFLKEFGELNIKLPDDTRENERLADDASDVSLIDMDDEELKQQENTNRMDQKKKIFGSVSNKNVFKKSKIDDDDYEDFEDHPKVPEIKANPYEQLSIAQMLTIIGADKSGDIYRYTDLYLPTTKENQQNVNKFLYKNLLRNPKDALKKNRHEKIIEFERAILRMFGKMYEQRFAIRQESIVQQTPEANVSILKDSIKNPILYSQDPVFSPLNSAEWFESLQSDLVKGIKKSTMEIEKEEEEVTEKKKIQKENINGWGAHHEQQDHSFFGNHDNKLIHMEPSSRRVPNSVSYSHNHEKSKAEKNFSNALANLFESTPTREQDEKQNSENGEEERSNIHPFDDGSQAGDEGADGFLSTYKRSVNLNMREYLNNNYDQDRRALFSFYTMMKGHEKPETALWGETRKEILDDNYQTRANINFNYMILPFNNNNNRSIFKYQADVQDVSEVELGLLHKKRRVDKNTEVRIKIGPSSDATYFNKNVLEASWNDFFFQPKNQIKREKEYNQLLIDLNDKSVFYDKIHPMILGVQKASKKAKEAQEEEAQEANPLFEPQGDETGEKRIDNLDSQVGTTFRPGFSKDYLTALGGKQAPSETDSRSMSRIDGPRPENKEQKRKMKEIRVNAVRQGLDPDNLTKENARELLGRSGRTESKSESVALPSVLKLVNDLKRKTGSQAVIQHSKVAEEFQFNEFHIKKQDFEYFHRPDLKKLIDSRFQPWRIDIVKQEEEKKEKDFVPEDPFGVKELVHSFEHFKNHRRLSLREGKFALFEYIEENPLILSNVGMASRINRYVYSQRAYSKLKNKQPQKSLVDESEELKDFIQLIKDTLGSNGSISFLEEKQNLPLIGQLTNDRFIGVTVIDNNMFTAPIFIHKAPETDFVLVRYTSSDGSLKCYLRKIEYIYTVGQIEPKVEVFNPSCRGLTSFIRKSIKHVIRKKFNNGEAVLMEEMKQLFPTVNDHNMKNYIQMSGGDPDPEDTKRFTYNKEADHDLMEEDMDRNQGNITPEEVCQYERMHASNVRLKNIGLEDMRSCDKINTIRNRYIKRNNIKIWGEETDLPAKQALTKMNIIANNVSEELQLTAWNLSQSFLSSKQKQGRLYLTGFGDPTGGHGGYSYVKLPLKTSRYEKEEKKNNAQKLNQVTGTESDLRKLPIKHVDRMILSYGNYKEEHISKLSRWDKIDLLRQIANDQPDNEELAKYARSFRLTTKMQREKYQKDINGLFMNLVTNLSKQGNEDIPSDDEGEFECRVESLIDKELEEVLKKTPTDIMKVEDQVKMEEDDDDGNVFDF